jgi:hypothetical protein
MVNMKKKWNVMNPIWHRMKKCYPFSGQNDRLVHLWLLVHSGPINQKNTQSVEHSNNITSNSC